MEISLKFITLLTDFGLQDGFVGVMRGVILSIAPDAQIADISHRISPQNVQEGSLALARTVKYYPKGCVHVVVVDPGVGTARRPIAAQMGDQYFVAPDNGVLSHVYDEAESNGMPIEMVHLNNPKYWLPKISNVFHGRDIFAPVGAHLANGIAISTLGSPIEDIIRINLTKVEIFHNGLKGQIVLIDNFGNLITNIESKNLDGFEKILIVLCGTEINGMAETFGERENGELIALIGDAQDLWISVVNGSACDRLGAKVGDTVEILAI